MACNHLSFLRALPTHCYLHTSQQISGKYLSIFFMAQQLLLGQGVLIIEASRSRSHISHSSGRVMSPSQRPLPNNTQHSQQTDIHAHAGIHARFPSKWTAADTRRKYLMSKSIPKLNTECEFNFVAHCTWDPRLSQRCLWYLLSITESENLPVIRRNLLLLSSGGIGSGRGGSLSETLIYIYQTVWCSMQETCSAEWRVLQRCYIQVKMWMSPYTMSWRHGGEAEI